MATVAIRDISDPSYFTTGSLDNSPDVEHVYSEITKQVSEVLEGNTNRIEIMLTAQAKTLDLLFNAMITRSFKAKHFDSVRYHMDIALRAQNLCRKTLLALDTVKNPPQKQIVGQQNIAFNQQVNNGTLDIQTPSSFKIKPENELLEAHNEQWMDKGTSTTASKINSPMETVGIGRRKNTGRKSN